MKFYWDSKSLRRDLKVLERKFKEERNPGLKEELGNYIAMIKKQIFYEEVEDEKDEEQECLDNITTEVPAFEMYYPYIKVFKQKLDRFVEMAYYPKKEDARKRFLKKEEIVELVHELFKSTNKEIYEKFCSIYNNRYQTIRFLDKDAGYGRMIFIPGINKPYTSLGNPTSESYRLSLITATHEMSHGVYSLINPRRYTEDDYFFQEIETSFLN